MDIENLVKLIRVRSHLRVKKVEKKINNYARVKTGKLRWISSIYAT